jgi:hypothetical protein
MRALTAQQLLSVWESGQGQSPARRALALLAAACPAVPLESLAALSVGQRDARLLRLREWAFGSQLTGVADCPQCGERLEMSFAVDDIRTDEDNESPEPLSLRVEDYELRFRLPNSSDLMAMTGAADPDAIKQMLIERCVLQAGHRGTEIKAAQLPDRVVAAISRRMAEADPQADIQLALDCPSCEYQWRATFDIVSFFWREIGAWAGRVLREVHILASAYGWREDDILAMNPWRRQSYLEMVGS